MNKLKITTLGGGTGQGVVLQALKNIDEDISAIVGMADSGGSSGKLREELDMLPLGDLRHCLLSLSKNNVYSSLFDYRFEEGSLKGHNFGNLFLAGLYKSFGSYKKAITQFSKLLEVHGVVIPVTYDKVHLYALLEDGTYLFYEDEIDAYRKNGDKKIERVWLEPLPQANNDAVERIIDSDYIIIGPGDLYTSIVQALLVPGIAESLCCTKAKKIYLSNIMTKFGQTNNLSVADQLRIIEKYSQTKIDYVLVNNNFDISKDVLLKYKANNCDIQLFFKDEIVSKDCSVLERDFLSKEIYDISSNDPLKNRSLIRHDPEKIKQVLWEIF